MTGKEQEIKALTKLVEMNGYFAEYFRRRNRLFDFKT